MKKVLFMFMLLGAVTVAVSSCGGESAEAEGGADTTQADAGGH